MRVRNVFVTSAALVAVTATIGVTPAAAGSGNCKDERVQPASASKRTVTDSILCLLNKERAQRGMSRLDKKDSQRKAAARHNRLMVKSNCFAHECSGEGDIVTRLTRSGYLPWNGTWKVGENIAWGTGKLATPESTVKRWMNSPPHRHNILDPDFDHIGIAVHEGAPVGGVSGGATYTTDFGMRR